MNSGIVLSEYFEAVRRANKNGMVDRRVALALAEALKRWEDHAKELAKWGYGMIFDLEEYDSAEDYLETLADAGRRAWKDWNQYAPQELRGDE